MRALQKLQKKALRILLLALIVSILPTGQILAQENNPNPNPGGCFIYKERTSWYVFTYAGGYQYHDGCEGGGSCGPIKGYDYIAPEGTAIKAPFTGTVTFASQSIGGNPTICSGTDGVGNSVFKMLDDRGIEFGMLHSSCDGGFQVGDVVEAGQKIAEVSDVGNSPGHPVNPPHPHVWFRDTNTGENFEDHSQFWQCANPPAGKLASSLGKSFGPEIIGQASLAEAKTFVELLRAVFATIPNTAEPPSDAEKYQFYISAQHADPKYQYNILAFFAGYGMQQYPDRIEERAQGFLFNGYWEIPPGGPYSINKEFGWGGYCYGQGMKDAPGPNGEECGNGVCHNASMLRFVLSKGGLLVEADVPEHSAPVAGVPDELLATVYIPDPGEEASEMDVRVTNPYDYPMRLQWEREGDLLTLWVEPVGKLQQKLGEAQALSKNAQAVAELVEFMAGVNWGRIGAVLLAIAVTVLLTWLWTKVFRLKIRVMLAIFGISILVYSWVLPKNQQWLESPITGSSEITLTYGDPRVLGGSTAMEFTASDYSDVVATVPGRVISSNNPDFKDKQVWIEVGNGLYVQYANLTTISVEPGKWVRRGQKIGEISTDAALRFGTASKHPDQFIDADERGLGWVDPAEYLGQSVLSGRRQEDVAWTVLAWFLLLLVIFWPTKKFKDWAKRLGVDFPYPLDGKRLMRNWALFAISLGLVALGIYLICPYLVLMFTPALVFSLFYLAGREIYRLKVLRGLDRPPSGFRVLLYLSRSMWLACWFVGMIALAASNPDLMFAAKGDLKLNLPKQVLPALPFPDQLPPWLTNSGEMSASQNGIAGWDTEWSYTEDLPQFQTTWWNGATVTFRAPEEVWAAILRQAPNHPSCDPLKPLVVAFTEDSLFTNFVEENGATAAGTFQFIRGTWYEMMPGVPLSGRNDLDLSAEATFRYMEMNGLCAAQSREELISAFITPPVWNAHRAQATCFADTYLQLKAEIASMELEKIK